MTVGDSMGLVTARLIRDISRAWLDVLEAVEREASREIAGIIRRNRPRAYEPGAVPVRRD